MDKVTLAVNGRIYEGWKSVSVKRNLKALSGGFSLSVTDSWNYTDQPWRLRPGDSAELRIGSDLVMTGWIDDTSVDISKSSKSVSVSGRDLAGDLVDCSADLKKTEFRNLKTERLVQLLCEPFGIKVKAAVSTGAAHPIWTIQRSETVAENIAKLAKKAGLLAISAPDGGIILTRNAQARASSKLVLGENILQAGVRFDHKNRFSIYKVQAQASGSEFSELDGEDAEASIASIQASAADPNVKRYRPLIVLADSEMNAGSARQRARWESRVRAAQATQASAVVQGWRQADGRLWGVNELVKIEAPWLGLEQEMLVTSVDFTLSDDGTKTSLELEPPDAYLDEPVAKEKSGLWSELTPENAKRS